MYNRYVDGLDTWQPQNEELYRERGKKTAREGYVTTSREYLPAQTPYEPNPETLALLKVSGNPINGLGETTVRRASPFCWHPSDLHPFGELQLLARQSTRKFLARLRSIPPEQLIFLDESGVSTQMTRRYARAPRGVRVHETTPEGNWKILTILAAMSLDGIVAPMTIEPRPTRRSSSLTWITSSVRGCGRDRWSLWTTSVRTRSPAFASHLALLLHEIRMGRPPIHRVHRRTIRFPASHRLFMSGAMKTQVGHFCKPPSQLPVEMVVVGLFAS